MVVCCGFSDVLSSDDLPKTLSNIPKQQSMLLFEFLLMKSDQISPLGAPVATGRHLLIPHAEELSRSDHTRLSSNYWCTCKKLLEVLEINQTFSKFGFSDSRMDSEPVLRCSCRGKHGKTSSKNEN